MSERRYKIKTICPHCLREYELETVKLHGEGKEEAPPGLFHGPPEYRERAKITDDQPDPWEAWVEEMPYWGDGDINTWDHWQMAFKDWFRKMPRGK